MVLQRTELSNGQWSDEILVSRLVEGDVRALEALYDRYAPMVFGIALKITGDRPLAEEVLKETFWRVWKSASAYQTQHGSFTSRLFRLARELALRVGGRDSSASHP